MGQHLDVHESRIPKQAATLAMTRPPTGEQFDLESGEWRLTVVEVGGGLRELRRGDWRVLDGYPVDRMCNGGRGQALLPWPNRIDGGRYTFEGQPYQLALTEPLHGNAIHGLTRWSHWRPVERSAARVVLAHELDPQPGYPFSLSLRLHYELTPQGLTVRTSVTNAGVARCPVGVGFHPYFSCGPAGARVDASELTVPGREYVLADQRGIPTGRARVDGTLFDFRRAQPIGELVLDHAFASLERDRDGRTRVELASADQRRRIVLWLDENYRYVQVFTGDTLPQAERRLGVAIEPMTCPANAFSTGESLRVLEPGESWRCEWGIA
jgi:aldose 1-epimerase